MKEEKMANKLAEEYVKHWIVGEDDNALMQEAYKDGFLEGLKAGRPQWHDLRKDPNDLPKEDKQYLCLIKSWVGGGKVYACLIYNTQYHSWQESYGDVIAWCEEPQFEEE